MHLPTISALLLLPTTMHDVLKASSGGQQYWKVTVCSLFVSFDSVTTPSLSAFTVITWVLLSSEAASAGKLKETSFVWWGPSVFWAEVCIPVPFTDVKVSKLGLADPTPAAAALRPYTPPTSLSS